MEHIISTVSTKGQLVIPAGMRETLGILPGSRVALTLEDGVIVLRPVSERLVDETCGMFRGGPSLADELQQERRVERW
jgi:AbrB family looped-hinge helix DNA binding protein